MNLSWVANTDQGRMVGDYMSTSFGNGAKAFPVFALAKAPTGTVFAERAAAARFDVSLAPPAGLVRTGRERVRFRPHRRPDDVPETPTAR